MGRTARGEGAWWEGAGGGGRGLWSPRGQAESDIYPRCAEWLQVADWVGVPAPPAPTPSPLPPPSASLTTCRL